MFDSLAFVFVDDGSPIPAWWDASRATGQALSRLRSGHTLVLQHHVNAGAAAARDAGMRAARDAGIPYALLTDVDCIAAPDWAEKHVAAQTQLGGGLVAGVTRGAGNDVLSNFHSYFGHLNPRLFKEDKAVVYGATCNLSLDLNKAHVTEDGSYFDASFPGASYEDVELCLRNTANGVPLVVARGHEAARVRHVFVPPGTRPEQYPGMLFERFRRYGASEQLLFDKHPNMGYEQLFGRSEALDLSEEPPEHEAL